MLRIGCLLQRPPPGGQALSEQRGNAVSRPFPAVTRARRAHRGLIYYIFFLWELCDSVRDLSLISLVCFLFGSKKLLKKVEWGSTNLDQNSARNLRQRLSPKAQPRDSGNTGQEKRQSCHSSVLMALRKIEGIVGFSETGCHDDSVPRLFSILIIL
jgi:hypothetical protein